MDGKNIENFDNDLKINFITAAGSNFVRLETGKFKAFVPASHIVKFRLDYAGSYFEGEGSDIENELSGLIKGKTDDIWYITIDTYPGDKAMMAEMDYQLKREGDYMFSFKTSELDEWSVKNYKE
ncbi:MAG: hypothetical protein ACJ75J_00295 [Cytophagaceae bacterium]